MPIISAGRGYLAESAMGFPQRSAGTVDCVSSQRRNYATHDRSVFGFVFFAFLSFVFGALFAFRFFLPMRFRLSALPFTLLCFGTFSRLLFFHFPLVLGFFRFMPFNDFLRFLFVRFL